MTTLTDPNPADNAKYESNYIRVTLHDLAAGLGMAFSGGYASANGNQPLCIKRIYDGTLMTVCLEASTKRFQVAPPSNRRRLP